MAADASRSPRNTPDPSASPSSAATAPWNRICASRALASRRLRLARETCAHGRPDPCAALGGAPFPCESASRSSASDQSDSDSVVAGSSTGAESLSATPWRASASSDTAAAVIACVVGRAQQWRRDGAIRAPGYFTSHHRFFGPSVDSREFRVPGTQTISPYHRHAGGSRTKSRAHRWLQVGTRLTHPLESDPRRLTRATYPKRPRTRSFASRARRNLPSAPRGPATRPATRSATCPGTRSRPFPRRSPRPSVPAAPPPRLRALPRDRRATLRLPSTRARGVRSPRAATGDGSSSLSIPHASRPETRNPTTANPPPPREAPARRRRRRTTSRPSFPHLSRDARANRPVVDTNTNRRVSIRIRIATTTLRRTRRRAPSPSRPASKSTNPFATNPSTFDSFATYDSVRVALVDASSNFVSRGARRGVSSRRRRVRGLTRARLRGSTRLVSSPRRRRFPGRRRGGSPSGSPGASRATMARHSPRVDCPGDGRVRVDTLVRWSAPHVRARDDPRGGCRGPSGRGGRSDGAEGGVRDGAGDVAGGDGADLEVALAASKRGGLLRSEFVSTGADATHQLGEHRGRVRPRVGRAEPVPEDAAGGERAGASGGRGGRRRGSVAEVAPGEPGADAHRSSTRRAMCRTRAEKRVDVGARRRQRAGMRTFEPARLHESIGASHLNMEYDEIT